MSMGRWARRRASNWERRRARKRSTRGVSESLFLDSAFRASAPRSFRFPSFVSLFVSFVLSGAGQVGAGGVAAGRRRTVKGRGGRRTGMDCI